MTRRQNLNANVGKTKKLIIILVAVVLIVASLAVAVMAMLRKYTPPKIDSNQEKGIPQVDEGYLYDEVATSYEYDFSIAANLYQQEDHTVNVFLTNTSTDGTLLQCKIVETDTGKTLYKSGLVEPGYFLTKVKPVGKIKNEKKEVTVEIYAFERNTWYSKGTTTLNLTLQPW